jgi:NAD(P)-dependent dehydrogenase (short-subunit alcohol dehydrogenase family)
MTSPPLIPPDRVTRTAGYPVAIVLGGSCSDGRDVVRELASQGYAIAVVYLEDQVNAEATVDEVLAAGGAAVTVRADLTDDLDVERVFTETIAAFAGIDVVVHATTHGASVLYEHASRHLRPGSAIFSVSGAGELTPMLAQRLLERDVTINGALPGVGHAGAGHEVSDLLAMLERWRDEPPP